MEAIRLNSATASVADPRSPSANAISTWADRSLAFENGSIESSASPARIDAAAESNRPSDEPQESQPRLGITSQLVGPVYASSALARSPRSR